MNHISKVPKGPMFSFGGFAPGSGLRARFGGKYYNIGGDTQSTDINGVSDTMDLYGNDVDVDANGNITTTYIDNLGPDGQPNGTQTIIDGPVTQVTAADGTVTYQLDTSGSGSSAGPARSAAGAGGILSAINGLFKTPGTAAPVSSTAAKPATASSSMIIIAVVVVVVIVIVMAMGKGGQSAGVAS